MRILFIAIAVLVLLGGGFAPQAQAGFDFGISVGKDGVEGFHLSVGEYYGASTRSVTLVAKRLPEEEVPVAFFLATRAGVKASVIMNLRLRGASWMDITLKYGLSPSIYYVKAGPPYGKAWGHLKKPRKAWKTAKFSDAEVVSLVNLKFVSEHHGISPSEVMKMRDAGKGFVEINGKAKHRGGGKAKNVANKGKGQKGNKGKKK
jgi:hypothetical protein